MGDVYNWEVPDLRGCLESDAVVKTQKLGDIISDVYPAFDEYREDMKRALELAFTDKDRFVEVFFVKEFCLHSILQVVGYRVLSGAMILFCKTYITCFPFGDLWSRSF